MPRRVMVLCALAFVAMLPKPSWAQTVQPAPLTRPRATLETPAQQIAALQQQVAALQQQVNILNQKTKYITSGGKSITIEAPGTLTLGSRDLTSLSGSQLRVESMGTLQIRGAQVSINNGGKPAARAGDAVAKGSVTSGSSTVLIGQ
jgi:uncharacterized Zn-binding protein involved in type VI secretion